MLVQVILLAIGAYLLGSIPTSYIAGRVLKGIDIRDYGSGTVSGSNVWHSLSRWATVPVGIFDVLKGFIPVYIAAYVLDFTIVSQGIVAMAAMTGHSWSIYLGFSGGRGFATMIGSLVVLGRWELLVFVVIWVLGLLLLKNSPLWMLLGAAAMPLASLGLGRPQELIWVLLGILLLLVIKRLMADRGAIVGDWRRVMIYRLLFDRDTRDRQAWIYRTPSDVEKPPKKK
jgi:glycerol-3-phosphate acyltransferase PlsY